MLLRLRLAKSLCEQVGLFVSCGRQILLDASPLILKDFFHNDQSSRKVFGLGATVIPLHQR